MITELKIVTATLVVAGAVVGFLDHWYAPHVLVTESSPNRPWWLGWLGWFLASASGLLYILLDYLQSWRVS